MNYSDYDFKYAKLLLHEMEMLKEIETILRNVSTKLGRNIRPTPAKVLQEAFIKQGWNKEYSIPDTFLRFDLYKNKVAIEIELTDPADCYNDYLKFLLGYNSGLIEVGIEIVYDDTVSGENLPKLSKVRNDLTIFRRIIPCPIWVIGLK